MAMLPEFVPGFKVETNCLINGGPGTSALPNAAFHCWCVGQSPLQVNQKIKVLFGGMFVMAQGNSAIVMWIPFNSSLHEE